MSKKENSQSNPLFIIIVFLLIIGAFIALPYLKGDKSTPIVSPNNKQNESKSNQKSEDKEEALSDYIKIGEKKDISFNDIKVSNPTYKDRSLTIEVSSEKNIELEDLDYYVEFYKEKKQFLFRRTLKGTVSSNDTTEINFLDIDVDGDVYIAISHIDDSAIPKVKFTTDETGISGFSCKKNNVIYEYDFNDTGLIRVNKKESYTNNNLEEFSNKLFETQKEANKLNQLNGVTANVVEANKEYIYKIEIDYLEADDKKLDNYFFSKGLPNYVVLFKMNSEGFDCL